MKQPHCPDYTELSDLLCKWYSLDVSSCNAILNKSGLPGLFRCTALSLKQQQEIELLFALMAHWPKEEATSL